MRRRLAVAMAVGLVRAGGAAAGPSCPPAAALAGEPAVVAAVGHQLAVLGVGQPRRGCPALRAVVNRDAGRVVVAVARSIGRPATRVVSDPRIAAAWIETWLRPEIAAPVLAARGLAGEVGASPTEATGAAAVAASRGIALGVAAGRLYADDGSAWRALEARGCVGVAGACLGAGIRVADSDGLTDLGIGTWDRLSVDAAAQVGWPIALEHLTLTPTLGLGAAWVRTRQQPSLCMIPDAVGACTPVATRHSIEPRLEVATSAAFPLSARARFVVEGGAAWAPVAASAGSPPAGNGVAGDGGMPVDPAIGKALAMPADPGYYLRVGVGLAVELR